MLQPKVKKIIIQEEGKDAENWAGHFGAEFSGERFYLEYAAENRSSDEESKKSMEERNLLKQFRSRGFAFE